MDYKGLNSIIIKDRFSILVVEELMDELFEAKIFSKLDLRLGYHQIWVKPKDVQKIGFRTHERRYEFLVMSFGVTNAPSTFPSIMNEIFKPYLKRFMLGFFSTCWYIARVSKST